MLRAEACGLKLAKLGRDVRRLLLKPIEDVESLSKRCNQINHYLRQEAQQVTPEAYFLVLGSFRHFLYIGMSHAMMLGTDAEVTRRFYLSGSSV